MKITTILSLAYFLSGISLFAFVKEDYSDLPEAYEIPQALKELHPDASILYRPDIEIDSVEIDFSEIGFSGDETYTAQRHIYNGEPMNGSYLIAMWRRNFNDSGMYYEKIVYYFVFSKGLINGLSHLYLVEDGNIRRLSLTEYRLGFEIGLDIIYKNGTVSVIYFNYDTAYKNGSQMFFDKNGALTSFSSPDRQNKEK